MEELDAMASTIAGIDDDLTPRTPEQLEAEQKAAAQADPEYQAQAWAALVQSIGGMLSIIAPELRQVYTDDACMQWGRAVVPVAEKYGWNGPSSVPELGLIMASVPLALPTGFILARRLKELREAKEKADEARTVDNGDAGTPMAPGGTP